jgi:hypothetical protein
MGHCEPTSPTLSPPTTRWQKSLPRRTNAREHGKSHQTTAHI